MITELIIAVRELICGSTSLWQQDIPNSAVASKKKKGKVGTLIFKSYSATKDLVDKKIEIRISNSIS